MYFITYNFLEIYELLSENSECKNSRKTLIGGSDHKLSDCINMAKEDPDCKGIIEWGNANTFDPASQGNIFGNFYYRIQSFLLDPWLLKIKFLEFSTIS